MDRVVAGRRDQEATFGPHCDRQATAIPLMRGVKRRSRHDWRATTPIPSIRATEIKRDCKKTCAVAAAGVALAFSPAVKFGPACGARKDGWVTLMGKIAASLLASVGLIVCGAVYAQTKAQEASYYCHTGVKAQSGSSNDKAFFDQVRANCRKGDVIVIPNNDTYRAARLCDFTRSVAATGGHIVCVIAGAERPTR
jgi:hypothetical protein